MPGGRLSKSQGVGAAVFFGPDDVDTPAPVAFPVAVSRTALGEGETVELAGVVVVADGGGLRALSASGEELPSHQAFWFAWSQFQPGTAVWTPLG